MADRFPNKQYTNQETVCTKNYLLPETKCPEALKKMTKTQGQVAVHVSIQILSDLQ